MGHTRRVRRVLIGSYGNALVPEIIKLLDEKSYCLFVIFSDASEIGLIQKALGRKRVVPILMDSENGASEDLLKNLPIMDSVVNLSNSPIISKYYEKRKHYKALEMKLQKATAGDVKIVLDTESEPCLINLIPETNLGLKHIFDADGIDIPMSIHLSTSIRNSFRKIFTGKKQLSLPLISDSNEPGSSKTGQMATARPSSYLNPLNSYSKSGENLSTSIPEKPSRVKKLRRSLSLLNPKNSSFGNDESKISSNSTTTIDMARNQVWEKENLSLKKSLNKLHSKSLHTSNKSLKKLNSNIEKKQRQAEKEIERDMTREKNVLSSKCNESNEATLARASALTPATADRIIASREARVNKEVCRKANKKKMEEFEKLDETHKTKVDQLKIKQYQQVIKVQIDCLQRTTKKYHEKLIEAERTCLLRNES